MDQRESVYIKADGGRDDRLQEALQALKAAAEIVADYVESSAGGMTETDTSELILVASRLASTAAKRGVGQVSSVATIAGLLDAAMLCMSRNVDSLAAQSNKALKESVAGVKEASSLIEAKRKVLKRQQALMRHDLRFSSDTPPSGEQTQDNESADTPTKPETVGPKPELPNKPAESPPSAKQVQEEAEHKGSDKSPGAPSSTNSRKVTALIAAMAVLVTLMAAGLLMHLFSRAPDNNKNAAIDHLLQANATLVPHEGIGSEMYFEMTDGKITACSPRPRLGGQN